MAPHVIVSYDGSPPDGDALALGVLLREVGARLTLAYVRHAGETRADRELIADVQVEGRLREGARRLGENETQTAILIHPSTAVGLAALAEQVEADAIVFGSEHRTARGRIGLGRSVQALLENGPAALALAPAGFDTSGGGGPLDEDRTLRRIGILPGTADEAAIETACSLAARHGAQVTDRCRDVDLLVVGSRSHAPWGRVMVSASARAAIEEAGAPVIVTARGVPLSFETLITV